jgi:COP9 signalosome complex subunit 1
MADAFQTPYEAFEGEISRLIAKNAIQARIDSHNKVMYAKETNIRQKAFIKNEKLCSEYLLNAKIILMRSKMIMDNLVVKQPERE